MIDIGPLWMDSEHASFRNFEAMTRSLLAAGYTPDSVRECLSGMRRQVHECPEGWRVTDSGFVTSDQTLARAVAAELDRIDPLPGNIDTLKHQTGRNLHLGLPLRR